MNAEATDPRARWRALLGAVAAQVGLSYVEQAVPALVPYIRAEFGLSRYAAGLFATGVNLGRAVAGVPVVRPIERFGERRMILVGAVCAGLLVGLTATGRSAPLTLGLLVLSGVAQTLAVIAGINAISQWFRTGARGMAIGLRQAAVPVGGALAAASQPLLAMAYGWRTGLAVAGAFAVGTGLAGMGFYRDYAGAGGGGGARIGLGRALPAVLRDTRLMRVYLLGVVLASAQYVVLAYIQLFMMEDLHAGPHLAATALALSQVAGIAGRLVWGTMSDFLFRGSRRGVVLTIIGMAAAGCVGMALARPASAAWLGLPMAALLGFATIGASGIYITMISDLTPAEYAATGIGAGISTILGSTVVVPPLFGALVDATSSYRLPWLALGAVLLLTLPVAWSIRTGGEEPNT